jgi:hypothetical protein
MAIAVGPNGKIATPLALISCGRLQTGFMPAATSRVFSPSLVFQKDSGWCELTDHLLRWLAEQLIFMDTLSADPW